MGISGHMIDFSQLNKPKWDLTGLYNKKNMKQQCDIWIDMNMGYARKLSNNTYVSKIWES